MDPDAVGNPDRDAGFDLDAGGSENRNAGTRGEPGTVWWDHRHARTHQFSDGDRFRTDQLADEDGDGHTDAGTGRDGGDGGFADAIEDTDTGVHVDGGAREDPDADADAVADGPIDPQVFPDGDARTDGYVRVVALADSGIRAPPGRARSRSAVTVVRAGVPSATRLPSLRNRAGSQASQSSGFVS